MHCGFLSYSLFYLTHIVALDTFSALDTDSAIMLFNAL